MKRVRQIVVMLGLCAVLSGTLSSLMANPVEDAAKIAECMRELQARHHYLYNAPGHSVQTEYRSWDSLTLCGGSIYTPYFPPDDWYAYELKEHSNSAERAKQLVQSVFNAFQVISGCFVNEQYWDLEGESVHSNDMCYTMKDFPELSYVIDGGVFGLHYNWISVTEDNYRQILDVLHQTIRTKLKVIQYRGMSSFTFDASSRMGIGTQHEPVLSCWSNCEYGYWCYGWLCPHKEWSNLSNTTWFWYSYPHSCDIGSFDYGIQESIHYCNNEYGVLVDHLIKSTRFKVRTDLRDYPAGIAKVYMMIRDTDVSTNDGNSFSNLGQLKPYDCKWQNIGNFSSGQEWVSDFFADQTPEFTLGIIAPPSPLCRIYGKGWTYVNHVTLIWPQINVRTDEGISFEDIKEEIYKDRDENIVYTIHTNCNDPNDKGEVIDLMIPCPSEWSIGQSTRLSAMVRVTSDKTKDVAYVAAGGWDGSGIPLEVPEQVACITKGPCSGCGLVLWDAETQSYRLKLSVVGREGGPKQLRFKVALWYQEGELPNLVTRCAEKEFIFTASPNRFECCAKEAKCGKNGCYSDTFEFPEIKKFKNNDIQVYFPVPSQTYIFHDPRPGFIHSVTLEEYDAQNPLVLIDSEGAPLSMNSAVVLRYDGGLGFVYGVPSSWWNDEPSGEGTFKYAIDKAGNILQVLDSEEYQVNGKTGIKKILSQADGSEKTEYFYDPDYPDRIWKIVSHDLTGYSTAPRERFVSYDDFGRITHISDGDSGCSSCSGGSTKLDYVYDGQGNVLQEKNAQGTVLYEYEYDTKNRMIAKWYGPKSEGYIVEEVVFADSLSGTVATYYHHIDDYNYRLEVEHFDTFGQLRKRIRFENLNENLYSPTGRAFVETYQVWPPSDYDPSIQAYWKLDEESGGWALDSSIYKRHGVLRNYPSEGNNSEFWVSGIAHNALKIEDQWWGTLRFVRIQGFKGVVGPNPRTVSVWINPTSLPNSAGRIIRWGGDNPGKNWEIRIETSGKLTVDIGDAYVQTNDSINPFAWQYITVVLAETDAPVLSDISIFINGVLADVNYVNGSGVIQTSDANDVVLGGSFTAGSTEHIYQGLMDEVMIFDRALTAREIEQLYQYQRRQQAGEYFETTIAISPKGNPDGTGPRRETIRTYKKEGNWYLSKQEERRYGFNENFIAQYASEYESVYLGGILSTRLKKSISQGAETVYEYDQEHPMRTKTEIQPVVTTLSGTTQLKRWYDYDEQGRIKEDREYTGTNPDTFLVARHYQYDSRGNLIRQYIQDGANPTEEKQVVEYKYNGFNEQVVSKSAEGIVSGKEYDSHGRTISEFVFANPNEWDLSPSQFADKLYLGLPAQNRLQVLSLVRYEYDSNGRMQFMHRAKSENAFAYCGVNSPAEGVTWATVQYTYDDYGNRKTIQQYVDSLNEPLVTEYSFNRLGEQDLVVHPTGRYQRTIRDGRAFAIQEIAGSLNGTFQEVPLAATTYKYDENGNLKVQYNSDGSRTENVYDEYGRIKMVYRGVVAPPSQP